MLNQALDELRAEGVLKALSIKFLGIDVFNEVIFGGVGPQGKVFLPELLTLKDRKAPKVRRRFPIIRHFLQAPRPNR